MNDRRRTLAGFLAGLFASSVRKRQDEAAYAAHTIRAFLNEAADDYDWDIFTSCSLRDPAVDNVRRRARDLPLPVDDDGIVLLKQLAEEAELLARR